MHNLVKGIMVLSMVILLLAACGQGNSVDPTGSVGTEESLKVVTTFTIIADIAREIGGEDVEIYNLVPTGTDPHEYEPLPEDIKRTADADILFYNGLNLEGGEEGWFFRMIESVGQKWENVFSLTERVEPMYLAGEDGKEEEINPHSFIDPVVGIQMAEDMRDALGKVDPKRKENYEERATKYIERLKEIDQEYARKISSIPKEKRILVTSERAFQYMTARYGLKEAFIWEIDTEENGSPQQIKNLIQFIEENDVSVLFIESNVDPRPMETVSQQTGVPLSQKPIFSDEIGQPGDEVDTYIKYLTYNINLIYEELGK